MEEAYRDGLVLSTAALRVNQDEVESLPLSEPRHGLSRPMADAAEGEITKYLQDALSREELDEW
jgi:hypothetical protein